MVHTYRNWDPGVLLVEICIDEEVCVERSYLLNNMDNYLCFDICWPASVNGVQWRSSFAVLVRKVVDFTMIKKLGITVLEGQIVMTVDTRLRMFLLLTNQKMMIGLCAYRYQHKRIFIPWKITTTKHVVSWSGSVRRIAI